MEPILWALLGIVAGACIAIQAPINAQLGRGLGIPMAAAGVSFVSGAIALWAVSFAYSWFTSTPINFAAPAPWLFVAGGILGAIYVVSIIMLTPMVGAAAVMALAVSGQLIGGLFLDKVGFMGMAVRELSMGRIAGVALLLTGALMVRFL